MAFVAILVTFYLKINKTEILKAKSTCNPPCFQPTHSSQHALGNTPLGTAVISSATRRCAAFGAAKRSCLSRGQNGAVQPLKWLKICAITSLTEWKHKREKTPLNCLKKIEKAFIQYLKLLKPWDTFAVGKAAR